MAEIPTAAKTSRYRYLFLSTWGYEGRGIGGPDGARTRDLRRDRPAF
jgi:hypothetical protein